MTGKGNLGTEKSSGPSVPRDTYIASAVKRIDWRRLGIIFIGIAVFCIVYFSPPWPEAIDPEGNYITLTREGKAALALFLLTAIWWVFEVVPIGVTSIAIAVLQGLFLIRGAKSAFMDFMHPAVWFIFASIAIGMAFTRTGLTKRMAYRTLAVVGERTAMIYLGAFFMTGALTLIMAHTAVAATVYPLLMTVYTLYQEEDRSTRFGKGLFIGMAFTAAAGSIVTLLGAARGVVAIGLFGDIVNREISFFELSYFMLPLGWTMIIVLWIYFMLLFRPERRTIPGLRERLTMLNSRLGPISRTEILTLAIVLGGILTLILKSFIPVLSFINSSAILLVTTLLFFLFKILTFEDLEDIPWNIILLFGGAMSLGLCLHETGAAAWLAVNCLALFNDASWFVFVMAIALVVLVMTNVIMNVAAIAIALPVGFVMAGYLGMAPDTVLFATLATAGMPFLFLIGAAPNAIAYESKQFTPKEFFMTGVPASILLMVVLGLFARFVWPLMGMPIWSP